MKAEAASSSSALVVSCSTLLHTPAAPLHAPVALVSYCQELRRWVRAVQNREAAAMGAQRSRWYQIFIYGWILIQRYWRVVCTLTPKC
jgi:hypothetical protein